jgi:vacuolar-type H+-ATPase subunit F/Vma7
MLVIGTSGAVYPAAGLAKIARRNRARVVIINPHASELDSVADQMIAMPSAQVLPLLLEVPSRQALEPAAASGKRLLWQLICRTRSLAVLLYTQPSAPSAAPAASSHSR